MIELAIGIDIGGTNTEFGLVNREGTCLARGDVSTSLFENAETFVHAVAEGITECQNEVRGRSRIVGIGAGAPNGNVHRGTIELANNLPWQPIIPLKQLLQRHFVVPVVVTNDANAAAVGEMMYGAAKGLRDFLVVTLGTGVGSGFVVNGEVLYGHDGFAGELGHTIIEENGRACGCGRRGCLETYASAPAFVETAREIAASSTAPGGLAGVPPGDLTAETVMRAAAAGDAVGTAALDYTARKLALGLANAVAITSPERIILFGGLARSGELLVAPTRRYLNAFLLNVFTEKIELVTTGMPDENAAILGAAAMGWQAANA